MESAEAIMENENNSNLESESNNRDRDQQISQRSNEGGLSHSDKEDDLSQSRDIGPDAIGPSSSSTMTNKSEEDDIITPKIDKADVGNATVDDVHLDVLKSEDSNSKSEVSHSKAHTASDLSADMLEDYEDFIGVNENSLQENDPQKTNVGAFPDPASVVDKTNEEPTEIHGSRTQEEPMEEDNFSLDTESPNHLPESGQGRETQSMEVEEDKEPDVDSFDFNREDLGKEKEVESEVKKSDVDVDACGDNSKISSGVDEAANEAQDWDDDIDLLAEDSEQDIEPLQKGDDEIQNEANEILPSVDDDVPTSITAEDKSKNDDLEENVEAIEGHEKLPNESSTSEVETKEAVANSAPAVDSTIISGENATQEMTDDLRDDLSPTIVEQEDSRKSEDAVRAETSNASDKIKDSAEIVEATAIGSVENGEENIMNSAVISGENATQEMTDDLRDNLSPSVAEQEDSRKSEDAVRAETNNASDEIKDSAEIVEATAISSIENIEENVMEEKQEDHGTKLDDRSTDEVSERFNDETTEINENNKNKIDTSNENEKFQDSSEALEATAIDSKRNSEENIVGEKLGDPDTKEEDKSLDEVSQTFDEKATEVGENNKSSTANILSNDEERETESMEVVEDDVMPEKTVSPKSVISENVESISKVKSQASQEESMDMSDGATLPKFSDSLNAESIDSGPNHQTSDEQEKESLLEPSEIQSEEIRSKTDMTTNDIEKSSVSDVDGVEAMESLSASDEAGGNSTLSLVTERNESVESVVPTSETVGNTESSVEEAQSAKSPVDNDSSQTENTISTNSSLTQEMVEKPDTNEENAVDKDSSQLSKDESSPAKANESDDDIVEIPQIKKEIVSSTADDKVPPKETAVSPKIETISGEDIKQEPDALRSGDGEDVVVLDDEGEVFPMKKEAEEFKATENGLGIQISAVSGQQHQLHANAEQVSSSPSTSATPKSETSKSKSSKSKMQTCIVCKKFCRCKYNIVRNGDIKHLCDDSCFKLFRKSPSSYLKNKDPANASQTTTSKTSPPATASPPSSKPKETKSPSAIKNSLQTPPTATTPKPAKDYKTCAVCKLISIDLKQPFCNWKGLDFCAESCLGKFQANLNTSCSFCHAYIPMDMRASFCLKIGNDMRPFCKQRCYNEFKKKLRLCAFCQRDVAAVPEAFTAMVGSNEKFKEFCSQACRKKMEAQVNDVEILSVEKGSIKQEPITCSVCKKPRVMKHTVKYQGKVNKLCSDLCLSAFQYINKLDLNKCASCGTSCTAEESQAHFVQFEGQVKRFCSDQCVGNFRKSKGKLVPCKWCATWKTNFDMIERVDADGKFQMFCSLNCLSLYRVNLQAKSNEAVTCDQCQKLVPAQYHLTMSDASVRNFCSYACVMTFQSQFGTKQVPPAPQPPAQQPPPQQQHQQQQQQQQKAPGGKGRSRMSTRRASKQQTPSVPVISNVMSLAVQGESKQPAAKTPVQSTTQSFTGQNVAAVPGNENLVPSGDGKHQILIKAASPKAVKNKSLQCRPMTQTKATSCRPHSQTKEIQTDEIPAKSVMVPIPVPIYIPMPTVMYSAPTPVLVPFPLPIPVPVFIPTTRKSANGISKTIKEIVERMPADPLEAELLMMAEAVASDKRPGDSDTDSENDGPTDDFDAPADEEEMRPETKVEDSFIMKKREGQGEEDMIQMALRMAEEMSGPIEDLESSVQPVAVSTEPPGQQQVIQNYQEQVEEEYIPAKSMRGRGAKRQSRGRPPAARPKRQRIERSYTEEDSVQPQPPMIPQSMEPPPDANYRLKFTYGVNAWRHWVISKNTQIEKTKQTTGSHRMRTFPTDILKCTTDELNFTLCMFIKEVRKPNGDEYSPDSIYYLCLGIQQYLYENGRIDNIFTDMYFEKFTDCLHETLKTLQPKVNNQGQMLCRIEEEHLWESKQLGAHSPYVLLNTLIYFHTKHFILKTAQEHMSLSFAQILKHWKKGMPVKGQAASSGKNVSLRFYCLANGKKDGLAARKNKEGVPVYEVTENFDNPLRCPVKLYEFFLSKCPESIKNRNDIFYPVPERSCVPDSPVWYSTQSIDIHTMDKMLTRVLLVREIQEAHLHAQPIYL